MNFWQKQICWFLVLGAIPLSLRADDDLIEQLEQKIFKDTSTKYDLSDPVAPTISLDEVPPLDDTTIKVNPKGVKDFTSLEMELKQLQLDIDKISSEIEQTRQLVIQRSQNDNLVKITILPKNGNVGTIQSISGKLDGFNVLDNMKIFPLALGNDELPIFYGPILPGVHRIDLSIRIADKSKGAMSMDESLFQEMQKDFTITVPEGTFHKDWQIQVDIDGRTAELTEISPVTQTEPTQENPTSDAKKL